MSDQPNNAEQELRELYRAVSTERSPERLDDAIRHAADAAVTERRRPSRWLPPLALAATLVIAVGVAFRGEFAVEHDAWPAPAGTAEAVIDGEPERAPAEAASALPQELRESAASGPNVLEAERFREKVRREALSSRAKPAPPAVSQDSLRLDRGVAATAFMDEAAGLRSAACSDDQRRTPERWLACMEALAERGDEAALAIERDDFARQHPDITLPPAD